MTKDLKLQTLTPRSSKVHSSLALRRTSTTKANSSKVSEIMKSKIIKLLLNTILNLLVRETGKQSGLRAKLGLPPVKVESPAPHSQKKKGGSVFGFSQLASTNPHGLLEEANEIKVDEAGDNSDKSIEILDHPTVKNV